MSIVLRLFRYLEYNHTVLKSHARLLQVVRGKMQEIGQIVERDRKIINENNDWSKKMMMMPAHMLRELLKESCDRLHQSIKDF